MFKIVTQLTLAAVSICLALVVGSYAVNARVAAASATRAPTQRVCPYAGRGVATPRQERQGVRRCPYGGALDEKAPTVRATDVV